MRKSIIEAARGIIPADVLFVNGRVLNVFTGEVMETSVAVKDGVIAGFGEYTEASEVVDLKGRYLLPGFIDAHIHIESTMLTPEGFAEVAVTHGTTTTVSDPHEVVNVKGMSGYMYMVESSRGLPVDIRYTVPSCVPATDMETSGASFGVADIKAAFDYNPLAPALSEMMNYPGVVNADPDTLAKLYAAERAGKLMDGHCPTLTSRDLNAYAAAGISSEHECTTAAEALEKAGKGFMVFVREGSTEKNLEAIIPAINPVNAGRFCLVNDDRHAADLVSEGGMDAILRKAVSLGLDPVTAVRMATVNPAAHYGFRGKGAIAPGYRADIAVVEDLASFKVCTVYKDGVLAARDGACLAQVERHGADEMRESVVIPSGLSERLSPGEIPPDARVRVIEVIPDQIIARKLVVGAHETGPEHDVLHAAVIERHKGTGNVGVGFVKGFGLKSGAIASTVAHDSHNLVVVGVDVSDMVIAAKRLAELGGGMAVVSGGRVLAELALPVAGLMSDRPPAEVAEKYIGLDRAAAGLGCTLESPFMTMSFIALPVIPELKLTDLGLVDVVEFRLVGLWD